MREEGSRTRDSRVFYVVFLISLLFILLIISGMSQAQTHSRRTAEFTLSNRTIKSAGEFLLMRETNTRYPLSAVGCMAAGTKNMGADAESNLRQPRNGAGEKSKGQSEVIRKPPINRGKVVGAFMAGSLLGMAAGAGAAYIGARITYNGTWLSDLPGAALGLSLAYPLGSALGVYLVGSIGSTTGSFSSTLGVAYGGLIIGTAGAYALNRVSKNVSVIAFLVAPPLLATFAFNKSRRYKNPSMSSTSLLDYKSGTLNLGFPAIMAFPSAPGSGKLDWLVNIASIEF
ncbi:MAG: hypothetical protein PVH84_06420 [Candidatus Aminicenantes bacterium]|jgi:hypothetical protein